MPLMALTFRKKEDKSLMNKKIGGMAMLVIGVIGLAIVYSMRPPSGFGEAIMMMGQGKQYFIREPLYYILLAVSGLVAFFGVLKLIKANKENK